MPESTAPSLAAQVARILRHEVGDLLQSIYSTTAILQTRLPQEFMIERQLIGNLKARAEHLKGYLDAITQLASPGKQEPSAVALWPALQTALARMHREKPGAAVACEPFVAIVWADPPRLSEALNGLIAALAEGASAFTIRVHPGEQVVLTLKRQGPQASEEQLAWLIEPFINTQVSPLGLQLACMAQLLRATGGQIQAANISDGLEVHLHFAVPLR
jgi:C4-dicarboxylate-specific signal transduction histidine kinase